MLAGFLNDRITDRLARALYGRVHLERDAIEEAQRTDHLVVSTPGDVLLIMSPIIR